jgi:hypothetical protein
VLDRRNSYPNRAIRRAARRYVSANLRGLLVVAGIAAVVCVYLSLAFHGYVAGLSTGIFISSMTWMVGLSFLLVYGMTFQVSGALGESNTSDELRAARRRHQVFGFVDNLQTATGDVDHLVVSPAGLLVIDSKWHSHGLAHDRLERDADAAEASALRARGIVHAVYGRRLPTRTLVVVWGGEQNTLERRSLANVTFVPGRELRSWLRSNAATGTAFNQSQARALLRELESFKRRVRPFDRLPRTDGANAATS